MDGPFRMQVILARDLALDTERDSPVRLAKPGGGNHGCGSWPRSRRLTGIELIGVAGKSYHGRAVDPSAISVPDLEQAMRPTGDITDMELRRKKAHRAILPDGLKSNLAGRPSSTTQQNRGILTLFLSGLQGCLSCFHLSQ